MSYDRLLNQVCPHIVRDEALFFLDDRMTVRPLRPIAAINSVRARYNGEVEVPSPGVHIAAQATGSKSGSFNIQGGSTDQLVIKVGAGFVQTLTLPSGNQITPERIVDKLNRDVRDAVFSVTARRQLRVSTSFVGPAATLLVKASGSTAANVLGMPTNRVWRGQVTVPGWSLINDPNTLADRPTRLLVFDEPTKGFEDYVELSYSTIRQECRRCGGLGVENDWRFNNRGGVLKAERETLLIQELLKAVYTVRGSNPFHPWYGTGIVNSLGRKLSSSGIVQNLIVSDIYEAFRRWQVVKRKQEEVVGQEVTDEEFPFRMLSVSLQQSTEDPTVIFVRATVQNRSNKPITIDRGVRVPMPLDLLGSTQQESLLSQSLPNYRLVE